MAFINQSLGFEQDENAKAVTQSVTPRKPKRLTVTVGFKIDADTHARGLELFPLRGELASVIRDIFLEQILALKDDPERLAVLHQKYLDNLKVQRNDEQT
jgi:hypothetical protein